MSVLLARFHDSSPAALYDCGTIADLSVESVACNACNRSSDSWEEPNPLKVFTLVAIAMQQMMEMPAS